MLDISWIDTFVKAIRPHVEVRREDSLLILIPNQAYKLNRTGLDILGRALDGEPIRDVLGPLAGEEGKREQVHAFFCDVRALLTGCLGEGRGRRAVEHVPYKPPFNTLPVLSEFAPTYRCNLACRFCYAGSPDGDLVDELDTAGAVKVIEVIRKQARVPGLSFTGGEPTLRKDLVELVAEAVKIDLRVNLITNGTLLTQRLVDALARAGLRSAQVSLEGGTAGVHDALVGRPGAFEKTLQGVRRLEEAGIAVHTNTTINGGNLDSLEDIVDRVRDLGLDRLSMNMVIPCGTAISKGRDLWVRYTDIGPHVLRVRRKAREAGVRFLWYAPTPYCLFNPVAEGLGNKGCAACDGLLSVAPDGSVLPCSSLREPVGNLLERPFREVWESAEAKAWRRKEAAPGACHTCSMFEICTGACPIYWEAMGDGELAGRGGQRGNVE